MTDLDPAQTVALFDSATVLRSSLEAALRGQPFPQLGNSSGVGRAARTGGKLPWPLLRRIYTRIGAAEGLDPGGLSDVNMASVARWLAEQYPQRRYPAVLVGSSNGAISHLAYMMMWFGGGGRSDHAEGDPHYEQGRDDVPVHDSPWLSCAAGALTSAARPNG